MTGTPDLVEGTERNNLRNAEFYFETSDMRPAGLSFIGAQSDADKDSSNYKIDASDELHYDDEDWYFDNKHERAAMDERDEYSDLNDHSEVEGKHSKVHDKQVGFEDEISSDVINRLMDSLDWNSKMPKLKMLNYPNYNPDEKKGEVQVIFF